MIKEMFQSSKRIKILRRRQGIRDTLELSVLALPGFLYFLIFHYIPMYGLTIAFKQYRYDLGILGSEWIGFDNFEFFIKSQYAYRVIRNTVGYSMIFIIIGVVTATIIALLLFEITNRKALKIYQTAMFLPNFMSWVLVGFIVFTLLNHDKGVINQVLDSLGIEKVKWYNKDKYWPTIIILSERWKNIGMGSLIYYAGLMGINKELFEAAQIDGASKLQRIWHISIPHIKPLATILIILGIGGMFRGDFGLFYNIPRNIGMLYETTDIIDTYIYRGLMEVGDIGMTSAVGFIQSFVGLVLVFVSNSIVKKINPDNALF